MSIYKPIWLYVKQHNETGLKYFGKTTSKDPHKYKGSGLIWKEHIKQHGYDVTTEIIRECKSKQEVKQWGKYYSTLWNIVESDEWANKIPETGGGNYSGFSQKRLDAISATLKGIPKTEEHRKKLCGKRGKNSKIRSGKKMARVIADTQKIAVSQALLDLPKTTEHKNKIAETLRVKCS
ncbi:MAG: hypothetical protein ACOVLB_08010, partial [Candidatus Nanopelagicus sp.]